MAKLTPEEMLFDDWYSWFIGILDRKSNDAEKNAIRHLLEAQLAKADRGTSCRLMKILVDGGIVSKDSLATPLELLATVKTLIEAKAKGVCPVTLDELTKFFWEQDVVAGISENDCICLALKLYDAGCCQGTGKARDVGLELREHLVKTFCYDCSSRGCMMKYRPYSPLCPKLESIVQKLPSREKIARTPIQTHKYQGKRYLTLDSIDEIIAVMEEANGGINK